MTSQRDNNLLGALVLSLHDEMKAAIGAELNVQGEAAAALVTIGNSPGQAIEWLRQALLLTHSGTVRLLDRLQGEGLIERRHGANDARALELHLTAAGRRRMATILAARRTTLDRALSPLSVTERRQLSSIVERMLVAITEEPKGDAICRLCEESVCPQGRCPVTQACASQ